jgi:hypothetical protein
MMLSYVTRDLSILPIYTSKSITHAKVDCKRAYFFRID